MTKLDFLMLGVFWTSVLTLSLRIRKTAQMTNLDFLMLGVFWTSVVILSVVVAAFYKRDKFYHKTFYTFLLIFSGCFIYCWGRILYGT